MKIKTNPLKVLDIEKLANVLRDEYKIGRNEYFPIFDVIDDMMVKRLLTYQIVEEDTFEDSIKAIYSDKENCIFIKESVLEEYDNNTYRSNFTLAHELFHFIQCQILKQKFEEVEDCPAYEDAEWQADEFAGQLLIPTEYVHENEKYLVDTFHVSIECVLVRKKKIQQRAKKV